MKLAYVTDKLPDCCMECKLYFQDEWGRWCRATAYNPRGCLNLEDILADKKIHPKCPLVVDPFMFEKEELS